MKEKPRTASTLSFGFLEVAAKEEAVASSCLAPPRASLLSHQRSSQHQAHAAEAVMIDGKRQEFSLPELRVPSSARGVVGRIRLLVVEGLRSPLSRWLPAGGWGCSQRPPAEPCHVVPSGALLQRGRSFLQGRISLQPAKVESHGVTGSQERLSRHPWWVT